MKRLLFFILPALLIACGEKPPELDVTEEEIDAYVAEMNSPDAIYDITFGLRYSRGLDSTYEVIQYEKGDTLVLHVEELMTNKQQLERNIYYMEGLPVYIEEYEADYSGEFLVLYDRKIYLNGAKVIKAYERQGEDENELEAAKFKDFEATIETYDFQQAQDAIDQEGDFALKFEEMLQISSSSWVVAGNEKSGFEVALLVLKWDDRLMEMRDVPSNYKGRRMKYYHTYSSMGGIESVVYVSSEFVE